MVLTPGDLYPDWSPDGSKIAFTSGRDGASQIHVMNADGSNPTRLTTVRYPHSDVEPSWSPDGTKIAFMSDRDTGLARIYVVNADGTGLKMLTNNPSLSDTYQYPSWSPDGTKIAFAGSVNNARGVFVMDANDGSDQTLISTDPRDSDPDWESIMAPPPPADTTAPVLTVSEDITAEATGPDGAQVSFEQEPSATDDVDRPVDVSCDYDSGDTFPIGGTVVTCTAEDAAGNSGEETFTVTVQDTTDPDVEITQVVDRRNRALGEGDTTPTPYIRVTFEAMDAVGVEDTECSLDGQGFTSCTSPVVYDRLSGGSHQVTVRATDEAGNTGEDRFLFTVGSPSSSSAAAPPGR